jgi:hypothetical protein
MSKKSVAQIPLTPSRAALVTAAGATSKARAILGEFSRGYTPPPPDWHLVLLETIRLNAQAPGQCDTCRAWSEPGVRLALATLHTPRMPGAPSWPGGAGGEHAAAALGLPATPAEDPAEGDPELDRLLLRWASLLSSAHAEGRFQAYHSMRQCDRCAVGRINTWSGSRPGEDRPAIAPAGLAIYSAQEALRTTTTGVSVAAGLLLGLEPTQDQRGGHRALVVADMGAATPPRLWRMGRFGARDQIDTQPDDR